jgi:formamidopyrimidine-DNA glycosylase
MDDIDQLLSSLATETDTKPDDKIENSVDQLLESLQSTSFNPLPNRSGNIMTTKTKKASEPIPSSARTRKVEKVRKEDHVCHVCRQIIESKGMKFKELYYHDHHFTCCQCNKELKGCSVFIVNGSLYCENDYHKRFGKNCEYCKGLIKSVDLKLS